jgi:hypothetical protein
VDFRTSEMGSGLAWAVKESQEKVESIAGQIEDVLGERTIS